MADNQVNEFENSGESNSEQLNETSAIDTMGRIAKFALIIALVLGLGIWQFSSLLGGFLHPDTKKEERGTVKTYASTDFKFEPPKITPPKKEEPKPEPEPEKVEVKVVEEVKEEPPAAPEPVKVEEPKPPSLLERRLASSGFEKSQAKTLPKSKVRVLDNPDFVILKGTKIPCVLESNVVSE